MKVTFTTTDFEQACGYPKEVTVTDSIALNIKHLKQREQKKDFEGAKIILSNIKSILDEPDTMKFVLEEKDCRTLLAVHKMIRANPIRLRYEEMNISRYFDLLHAVRTRLFSRRAGIDVQRKVVAEEMSKLNLYPQMITEKWQLRETKAPNRAFMDMLYKVRPELAEDDILRREYTKLCNAWEKKDEKALNEVRMRIIELGGTDFTRELKEVKGS